MKKLFLTLSFTAMVLSLSAQFHVLRMEEKGVGGSTIQRYTDFYFHSDHLRMDTRTGTDVEQSVLYVRDAEKVYMIDHLAKKYFMLDEEVAADMKERIATMKKMAEERIAQMPEEQQAMARQMMEQQMGNIEADFGIEATGENSTINDFDCSEYLMTENDELKKKMWVAGYSDLGVSKKEVACLEEFSELMASFAESMGSNLGDSNFLYQKEIQGLPVRSIDYSYGNPSGEVNLTEVETYTPTKGFFTLPASYTEQSLDQGPEE